MERECAVLGSTTEGVRGGGGLADGLATGTADGERGEALATRSCCKAAKVVFCFDLGKEGKMEAVGSGAEDEGEGTRGADGGAVRAGTGRSALAET